MANFRDNSFPLQAGLVNITTGSIAGIVVCAEAGSITVTWYGGATDTIITASGDAFDLRASASAVVVSGKFHSAI